MARHKKTAATQELDDGVGKAVRVRRIALGLTQQNLADAVGVTYQQMHKYERGINRISASMLARISEALKTEVQHFFEKNDAVEAPPERQALELAKNFALIKDARHRGAVSALARALAEP